MNQNARDVTGDRAIRIFIADDHALVRSGLRMLLEGEPDFEVVGDAADGTEALEQAVSLRPTVLLADITMPPPDGIQLARLLRRDCPDVKTLVVSMHEDSDMMREALAAGARGYVIKRASPVELVQAIRTVAAGEIYLDEESRLRLMP